MATCLLIVLTGCPAPTDSPDEVHLPESSEGEEIPLRFAGPGEAALVVSVYLNGEGPYDFVLDTGATLTCLDQRVVDQIGAPEQTSPAIGSSPAGTGRMTLVDLDSLRVGEITARGLSACVLDLEHMEQMGITIDGLLGLNFLRSFHVTLDFGRDVMLLERID